MSVKSSRILSLATTTACGAMALALATSAQAIVPNDNFTPADIVDNAGGVNGVGMFFRNDGFVCSGTLINPRTVLFAAHCVNSDAFNVTQPATAFNDAGGLRSAFSFDVNALPGFINWINNGFASNPQLFVYNISQIMYDPRSVQRPDSRGFLEGDIALATLDTPAGNVPTWALLFSALPTPDAIDDTTGTGYHVDITGYGRSGSGTTGASQGIDWRRRLAENYLGAVTSIDARNTFLFGNPFGDLPQNLYFFDFDDPNKANGLDFNLWKDEPLANEGTTAGGDSGGPLILDAANNDLSDDDLVIGVLSGGTTFFTGQPGSSYGTDTFYQPLFLYWDYIVANSPYRYVGATAGDGNWEDPNHWVTNLDPAFRIIDANGNVVNGLPSSAGLGPDGSSPSFGEVCFDLEGANAGDGCQDLETGNPTPPAREIGDTLVSGIGKANIDGLPTAAELDQAADDSVAVAPNTVAASEIAPAEQIASASAPGTRAGMIMGAENLAQGNGVDFAINAPQTGVEIADDQAQDDGAETAEEKPQGISGGAPEFAAGPNPAPTLDNGLPGATGFVPDNYDPNVPAGTSGRYFDVSLTADGVTTLSSTVTIDRLTVGGNAGLTVAAAGDLTSLIDITQVGGGINVNGALRSNGDYLLMAGILTGSGTVQTPFLTNIMGGIAPGTVGTVGTLTIDGGLVLASGSSLLIDLGDAPTSDLLAVTGAANLGGTVLFAPVAGTTPRDGDVYTILTAGGGVTGAFDTVGQVSAILQAIVAYNPNSVRITLAAGNFADVVDGTSQVQTSFANIFDGNRGGAGLGPLYDFLDLATVAQIQATFESLAPITETTRTGLGIAAYEQSSRFYRDRLSAIRGNNYGGGGTIAMIGEPVQLAAAANSGQAAPWQSQIAADSHADGSVMEDADIDDSMAIFLAGGFVDGSLRGMPAAIANSRDQFDGYFFAAGLEHMPNRNSMIGVSFSYTDLEAQAAAGQTADGQLYQGTIYGSLTTGSGIILSGQTSLGSFQNSTRRTVSVGPNTFNLALEDDALTFSAEAMIGKDVGHGSFSLVPNFALRYGMVDFDRAQETGGPIALLFQRPPSSLDSFQGRFGFDLGFGSASVRPRFNATYVHDFSDNPAIFQANFVGGPANGLAPFSLGVGQDRDWVEVSGGLQITTGSVDLDLAADTTVWRNDVRNQTYRATATFRF